MYNVKVFPFAQPAANATEADKKFLEELQKSLKESGASYINFSMFDYKDDTSDAVHVITYPIDWVTHYIQSQYIEIDPLFKIDYRRILFIDWADIQDEPGADKLFADFFERGIANNGVTLVNQIDANLYGVTSFCFQVDDDRWLSFRKANMEIFRTLGDRIGRNYLLQYHGNPAKEYKITKRETECLYWVAMGKTDEEIADLLSIGKWTVVGHLKSAKTKLNCTNRASSVATAMALGIIEIKKPGV